MLKLSKRTDYGLMAVNHLALHHGEGAFSAKDIAGAYGIPAGLMAKVLQKLAHKGLLRSQQGSNGGYTLNRPPEFISALDVIHAIEGPVMITSCNTQRGMCVQTPLCTVKEPLRKVNERIVHALSALSIAEINA